MRQFFSLYHNARWQQVPSTTWIAVDGTCCFLGLDRDLNASLNIWLCDYAALVANP